MNLRQVGYLVRVAGRETLVKAVSGPGGETGVLGDDGTYHIVDRRELRTGIAFSKAVSSWTARPR